jgi:hypothetical protein
MPTLNSNTPPGVVDLSDAPAGLDDATFDSLFPSDGHNVVAAPQAQPVTQTVQTQTQVTPQAQPATQVTPQTTQQPFIKGDKSVYNTAEAAVQGINQKDALIETLRQRYALTTGIDPITGQPVAQSQIPVTPQVPDYNQDPKTYMKDLYAAAQSNPEAYRDVQQKFLLDTLKPLQPYIQKAAREQAVETLTSDPSLKDAGTFIGTPAYNAALDNNPELKNAIVAAESDMQWHSRLPGLYKIAYLTGRGQQLPDLLAQQSTTSQNSTPTAPVRTTAQPSTPNAPTQTSRPSFKNLEGIRATIAEAEARGMTLSF